MVTHTRHMADRVTNACDTIAFVLNARHVRVIADALINASPLHTQQFLRDLAKTSLNDTLSDMKSHLSAFSWGEKTGWTKNSMDEPGGMPMIYVPN